VEARIGEPVPFLMSKVIDHDAVLLKVLSEPKPQLLRARLLKIYSARVGLKGREVRDEIEFVHGPDTWGNTAIAVGETALVFMRPISGRLYEDSWRGHMVIEDISGVPHAIFPHLAASTDPASFASRAVQDPKRPYARAIPLPELETYLLDLIAKVDKP
jgi:hypothetical protein